MARWWQVALTNFNYQPATNLWLHAAMHVHNRNNPESTSYLHFIISRCFLRHWPRNINTWFYCNLPHSLSRSRQDYIREEKRKLNNVSSMPKSIFPSGRSIIRMLFFFLFSNYILLSSGFKCTGIGNETEQKEFYSSKFLQGSALTAHVVVCLMIFDWLVSLPSSQSSLVVAVIVVEFAWWPKLKLPVFGLNCPSSWETSGDLAVLDGTFPEPSIVEPADFPLPEP